MTRKLDDDEKAVIAQVLGNRVFKGLLIEALGSVADDRAGALSQEESAMAYQYQEGAKALVQKLYAMSGSYENPVVQPRKLRHTN